MKHLNAVENGQSETGHARLDVDILKLADAEAMKDEWIELASQAFDPNVFFEYDQLAPALSLLSGSTPIIVACVFAKNSDGKQRQLIGLVPFERVPGRLGVTPAALRLWQHPYALLSTPLIHKKWAKAVWRALIAWSRSQDRSPQIIDMPLLLAEGGAYKALVDVVREDRLLLFVADHFTRAFLSEGPRTGSISNSKLSQLRRKRRRLEDLGHVEYKELPHDGDVDRWIEDFLRLEASGWKGQEGTAMACRPEHADYFRQICRNAVARQRLHMPALLLDGKPVAMKCNFLSETGAFWLKVAYDESLSKFSPGTLLELENVQNFPTDRWMDSCTAPTSYCDEIWNGRRTIQNVMLSTGGIRGNLTVGALPFLRAIKRSLRSRSAVKSSIA